MINSISSNNNLFMGIDVSKDTLDISVGGVSHKINNDEDSISAFIKAEIEFLPVSLCVLESTGGYERIVVDLLHKYKLPVHRAHPNRVFHFAKACGHNAKTDKLDALMLSRYAEYVYPDEIGDEQSDPLSDRIKELRRLMVCIEKDKHATQCRLKQFGEACRDFLNQQVEFYDNQLKALFTEIKTLIKTSPILSFKSQRIQTITGIAEKSASALLAEIPELGTLTKRQIASIVGVAPRTKQSGKKTMRAHIQGGRFGARKVLYMCALVAARRCPHFSAMYQRLIIQGKPPKVALVAIMRKLIITANALIKYDRVYQIGA
jgi:transposase